jgi:hypothetical protein
MADELDELFLEQPAVFEAVGELVAPEPAPVKRYAKSRMAERAERDRERVRGIEDKILNASLEVIQGVLEAPHVDLEAHDPNDPEYLPPGWLERYDNDVEAAKRAYRIALAGWSSKMPAFVKVASQQALGIQAARSKEKGGARTLNIKFTTMQLANPMNFPILDITDRGEK